MCFVDDDAIKLANRWRGIRAENAADHCLDGRDLDASLRFGRHVAQFLDVVDLGEGLVLLQRHIVERIYGLLAQGAAVDQE
ncbi:hypothetical protein D9M71_783840 [compost metagenome]